MERKLAEPTFTDLAVVDLGSPRARAFFDICRREIPFDRLATAVADIFVENNPAGGRPHWPVAMMLKVLFIQKCFGLSDPMAEEMLKDRISFRQFLGLSWDEATPDHSTISDFRQRLREGGHASTLFDTTLQILQERGLLVKEGTLIDATIIEAPLGGKRKDGSSAKDPCASVTVKGGRTHNGFRAHIAATAPAGLVIDYVYDTASESEHTHFDHLARNETRGVWADSGCRSAARVKGLEERGVFAGICHRRVRGQASLSEEQKAFNRRISPVRAFVEHPFAWFKNANGRCARYRGLARNAFDFAMGMVVFNFRRSFTLRPRKPDAARAGAAAEAGLGIAAAPCAP